MQIWSYLYKIIVFVFASKKVRACNICADSYKEKHGDKTLDREDLENASSMSDTRSTADTISVVRIFLWKS